MTEKAKESVAASRSESRFKVVGSRRNIDVDELDDDNLFHLVDIVQEDSKADEKKPEEAKKPDDDVISCNGVQMEKVAADADGAGGGDFVYDVYYHRRHPAVRAGDVEIFWPDTIDQVRFFVKIPGYGSISRFDK